MKIHPKENLMILSQQVQWVPESYSQPSRTSKRELLANIVNGFLQLTVFTKSSILDDCVVNTSLD